MLQKGSICQHCGAQYVCVLTGRRLPPVECDVDLSSGTVLVRALGANPSAALGRPLPRGQAVSLRHGDGLELLGGQHRFTVLFSPPPDGPSDGGAAVKRAAGPSAEPPAKRARASGGGAAPATGPDAPCAAEQQLDTLAEQWTSVENDQLLLFVSSGVKPSTKVGRSIVVTIHDVRIFLAPADVPLLCISSIADCIDLNSELKALFFSAMCKLSVTDSFRCCFLLLNWPPPCWWSVAC